MPRAAVAEAADIGSGFAPAPPTSGIDGPGVAAVTITTVPESTWVVVHASGSITLVPNPDCHGCPTTSPTFPFSPTPNVTGPVVVAANTGGPDDFFRMRGSGGTGESGGSAVGLQFVPTGAEIRARINIPESIRGFDPLTGSNAPSWLMSGGYGITATAVPSGIAVTESAPGADGTITYHVAPIMDLAFFNPINLGGPSAPQGAITWNYFVGDTADQTRPSGATYEITECQFQTECRWKPPAPGRMQVHAYVEMQSVYARSNRESPPACSTSQLSTAFRADVVTDCRQVAMKLTCDKTTVERGGEINCTAVGEPESATLEVSEWTFEGENSTIHPEAGQEHAKEWGGRMVVSGTITVSDKVNGQEATPAQVQITVQPRQAWSVTYPSFPDPEFVGGPGTPLPYPPPNTPPGSQSHGVLGKFSEVVPSLRVDEGSGPNAGWVYLPDKPEFLGLHFYLNKGLQPSDPFYQLQRGDDQKHDFESGQPLCGPRFMAEALERTSAHERGHYDTSRQFWTSKTVSDALESWHVYDKDGQVDNRYVHRTLVEPLWVQLGAEQEKWDRRSVLRVGCEFAQPSS